MPRRQEASKRKLAQAMDMFLTISPTSIQMIWQKSGILEERRSQK